MVQRVWHLDDALEQNYRLGSSPCRKAQAELEKNGKIERIIKSTLVFQIIRLKDRSYVWRKGPKKRKGRWSWLRDEKPTNKLSDYLEKVE